MTAGAGEQRERVRALVAGCLERMELEGAAAVDAVCAAHPDDAEAIRARLSLLVELGFVGADGKSTEASALAAAAAAAAAAPERH